MGKGRQTKQKPFKLIEKTTVLRLSKLSSTILNKRKVRLQLYLSLLVRFSRYFLSSDLDGFRPRHCPSSLFFLLLRWVALLKLALTCHRRQRSIVFLAAFFSIHTLFSRCITMFVFIFILFYHGGSFAFVAIFKEESNERRESPGVQDSHGLNGQIFAFFSNFPRASSEKSRRVLPPLTLRVRTAHGCERNHRHFVFRLRTRMV